VDAEIEEHPSQILRLAALSVCRPPVNGHTIPSVSCSHQAVISCANIKNAGNVAGDQGLEARLRTRMAWWGAKDVSDVPSHLPGLASGTYDRLSESTRINICLSVDFYNRKYK
jgi:hypothetical protein